MSYVLIILEAIWGFMCMYFNMCFKLCVTHIVKFCYDYMFYIDLS